MAGPTASILLPTAPSAERATVLSSTLASIADKIDGNDVWIDSRAFIVTAGPLAPNTFEAVDEGGLVAVLGWTPPYEIMAIAMASAPLDHRLLGELCLRLARALGGVIDFGGSVLPEPCLNGTARRATSEGARPPM